MMLGFGIVLILNVFKLFAHIEAKNWALLIAGSKEYMNYRHQADIAHAYQLLTQQGGYPAEQVIVMMYNDVAYDFENPKKGKLFNRPNGPDVYQNIRIDYRSVEVSTLNFLNVLSGNRDAMKGIGSRRVIESGPDDNVFVYYADHGAFGLLGMPNKPYLYANDLNMTLFKMSQEKRFKKMVFYIEACESGSMFDQILPNNENILGMTAADPKESSYAFYYDSSIGAYLGDEFSVHWLEDIEFQKLNDSYKLGTLYEKVKSEVKQSHVMLYGSNDMLQIPAKEFLYYGNSSSSNNLEQYKPLNMDINRVDVRDVEVETLRNRIKSAERVEDAAKIENLLQLELKFRTDFDSLLNDLILSLKKTSNNLDHPFNSPRNYDCLKSVVEMFEESCISLQGYGFKHVRSLSALCDSGFDASDIIAALNRDLCLSLAQKK